MDATEAQMRSEALDQAINLFKGANDSDGVMIAAKLFYDFLAAIPPLQEVAAKLPETVQQMYTPRIINTVVDNSTYLPDPAGHVYRGNGGMNEEDMSAIQSHINTRANLLYYVDRLKERGIAVSSE